MIMEEFVTHKVNANRETDYSIVYTLYLKGIPYSNIANELNIPIHRVKNIVYKMRKWNDNTVKRKSTGRFCTLDMKEVMELYNSNISINNIAIHFNVHYATVRRAITRYFKTNKIGVINEV